MASIALMGLLTGFAKGAAARIEKEKEENEALIQSRLKMAAINKKKREAEIEARKTALTERYSALTPFLDGSEAEEEKLALLSNDAITKDFVDRRSRGEVVDLKQYLVMNKEKVPQNFTSVQQYIDTLSAAPQPVAPEQMQAALGDTRGFLGARTGVSAGRAEKIAGALGAGSAAELLAYERMEPVSAEPLMDVARINVELFPSSPKSLDDQIERQASVVSSTADRFGEDSEQTKEAVIRLNTLRQRKDVLDPDQQTFANRLDRLKTTALFDEDPAKREQAKKLLADAARLGKEGEGRKLPSAMSMNNLLKDAASKAVSSEFGQLIGSGIVIGTATDEGGNTFNTYRYVGGNPQEQARIEATARKAMKNVVDTWLDLDGNPLSEDIATALAVNGILRKDGKFQWDVAMPPAEQKAPPTRTSATASQPANTTGRLAILQQELAEEQSNLSKTQDPTAKRRIEDNISALNREIATVSRSSGGLGARPQPAPAAAQPARASVNIAEARRNAQAAIAQGADAAAVRKRFKEMTGQDF